MVVTAGLLVCVVLAGWLGVVGFLRLRAPLDRLHCAAFVNAAGGLLLILAALAADGFSDRTGKIVLLVAANLCGGAAAAHAIGLALRRRGSVPETE
jgi:multisubunit Na+/H+ antiporter MnhG subunit